MTSTESETQVGVLNEDHPEDDGVIVSSCTSSINTDREELHHDDVVSAGSSQSAEEQPLVSNGYSESLGADNESQVVKLTSQLVEVNFTDDEDGGEVDVEECLRKDQEDFLTHNDHHLDDDQVQQQQILSLSQHNFSSQEDCHSSNQEEVQSKLIEKLEDEGRNDDHEDDEDDDDANSRDGGGVVGPLTAETDANKCMPCDASLSDKVDSRQRGINENDACDERQLLLLSSSMQIEEKERENAKLRDDLDRLRRHLISVEDEYTNELVTAGDRENLLRSQLSQYESIIQRLESQVMGGPSKDSSLRIQLETVTNERDEAKRLLSSVDDRVQELANTNERLQLLLEQTTKDYEEKLQEVEKRWESLVVKESTKVDELQKRLKWQEGRFAESVAALGAAGRLADQIDAKEMLILNLKEEISRRDKELQLGRKEIQDLKASQEGKVDKQIIKSLVLGYFCSPPDKKHEVERLLARILDFNQEEMDRARLKFGRQSQQQEQSLATAFVQFLEHESSPSPGTSGNRSPPLVTSMRSTPSNPVRQLAQNLFMSTVNRDVQSPPESLRSHSRNPSTASSTSGGVGGRTPPNSGNNSTGTSTPVTAVTPVVVTSMTANNLLIHPVNKINLGGGLSPGGKTHETQ